ncbi:hypothetical protein COU62_04440 [Candidatus Pacearchaeota archaeon CG10_big_fil_rev_8_21_14_0_10_35_219]|nr:hypothetical protein [Candidatus Pacearchaeota archaeon]OIO42085.1 MAG: hypothetical protein AUJ63_04030 [Candidatus Pacearchaeota archaeon CG1_02_35_32]PIO07241.1 MAG: hypothetical protein COU62_04440 [Candidatus Pacearchaeota archaeon CG10_big_fil_rev_8_21_14_0_10_35_219]PIY81190.1 MAG: hypothetical protein COY79_04070 [Candidatus Pacearchaeota archaeon CG_4_10_14_0_8_um_filter_35_169]PIZ79441.1 MAG: hypothetical protein COY00_04080 [Candidatus Pacearchaeota archaeon CG_4_10_14_0_2_um_filt
MAEKKTASWIKAKPQEIEKLVVELGKKNTSPEKIGLKLRDEHGIPKAKMITKKKICQILEENGIKVNPEKDSIERKIDKLQKHSEKHKHDYGAKRKLVQRIAQLRKHK